MYAQNIDCGTESNISDFSENSSGSDIYSFSIDENFLYSFPQRNMNIAIWGIEKTDGSQSISQAEANDMVEYLNSVFNQFNMCFNLIHFDYIVSDQYWDTPTSTVLSLDNSPEVSVYDGHAIKVIIPYNTDNRGQAWRSRELYTIRADQITAGINPHEMGHVLDLAHTQRNSGSSNCERVTRDPNDPSYNAETHGDFVVDTQATPSFYANGHYLEQDCITYTGNLTDCDGTPYNITITETQNFMAYTHQHCRTLFTTGQKIRMHEYIASEANDEYINILDHNYYDLYNANSNLDKGIEPDNQTSVIWESPDIWVRNQQDGLTNQTHQDLEYIDDNTPVYVYVKVKNKSCNPSAVNDTLRLYWAKGGIGEQTWPDVWKGFNNSTNVLDIGNPIGSQAIPILQKDEEAILEFSWQPKNPDEYENAGFTNKPWMFCFLSRIDSVNDTMTTPEGPNVTENTRNNNNIVYKNTRTVNISGNSEIGSISAGNYNRLQPLTSNINFFTNQGNPIWQEAEIRVRLSENLWQAWQNSGAQSNNIKVFNASQREISVNGNNSSLNNITFAPGEWGIITPRVNFLIKQVSRVTYTLHINQTESSTNEVLGGFTYHINRNSTRPNFKAEAHQYNTQNETRLEADDINEFAVYNWYDEDGNFISTGQTLNITNTLLKEYKLEVIADSDGHKDYEIFTAKEVRSITQMTPNPTQNNVTIFYNCGSANTAFISVTNVNSGLSDNYLLDLSKTYETINLGTKPLGQYIVNLVTDNVIVDTKQLLKN
jgi:hypothetical protein